MKAMIITPALSTTMRESPGLKQLAFWRRTISSMRGCCHLPGVETAGEALRALEGVERPLFGVRDAMGWMMAVLALVTGASYCELDCERPRLLAEIERVSEVEDMVRGVFRAVSCRLRVLFQCCRSFAVLVSMGW